MSILRRLDTHHALYASVALVLCMSLGLSLWMLGRLEHLSLLPMAHGQKLSALAAQVQAGYAGARLLSWITIGVTLGAAVLLGLWLRAELVRPVHAAAAMARRIADGDLSGKVGAAAAGEAGVMLETLQEMNDGLASMISKVRAQTESISSSAGQIAAGSIGLASRSTQQANLVLQAGAALAQLSDAVKQNEKRAQLAANLALSAASAASDGAATASNVATAMPALTDASSRIAELADAIDAIAFHTNLLALNARADLARAGEPGRAFALALADMLGLAQRSAAAARQIKLLADDSATRAGVAAVLADRSGESMRAAAASIKQVACLESDTLAAGAAVAKDIEQASVAIAAIDRTRQCDSALLAQSAASAAALRDRAGSLSRTTAAFVLGPEHGAPQPAIRLVSSNPEARIKPGPPSDMRNRHTPARATVALASVPQHGRGAFARRSMDLEEF